MSRSRRRPSNHIKFAALWLLSQGHTQQYVAEKFGVSQRAVSYWADNEDKIRQINRCDLIEMAENLLLGDKTWRSERASTT